MKIALIGYGKMGKAIEAIALERGHIIVNKVNSQTPLEETDLSEAEIAIEFSQPDLAVDHITYCLNKRLPVVVGTTAWNEQLNEVKEMVRQNNGSLLYASNFSVGVNIFFELNKHLARLMSGQFNYQASLEETHHLQKIDAPSGTAISLADAILDNNNDYESWVLVEGEHSYTADNQLGITSFRKPDVPGVHVVKYSSEIDTISISHEANSRKGFALGAVLAAEWLLGKKGVFTMKDVLNLN